VFEYLSAPAGASYRCRITVNGTGRALTLARIGVNGAVQASCTTPVNGTCDLPFVLHAGNLLFQCIVATSNGAPLAAGPAYGFAGRREPLILTTSAADAREGVSRSGFAAEE